MKRSFKLTLALILVALLALALGAVVLVSNMDSPEDADAARFDGVGAVQIAPVVVGSPGKLIPFGSAITHGAIGFSTYDFVDATGNQPQCCSLRPGTASLFPNRPLEISMEIRPDAEPGIYEFQANFVFWMRKPDLSYDEWGEQKEIRLRWIVVVKRAE